MLKYFKNIFVLITLGFIIWMLFLDSNSLLIHNDLNEEIEELENEKEYYRKEIVKDNKAIKELKKEDGLEKFAREAYYMKRENEDIYIIEYVDSLKNKNND
ncbi:septum formation initiator family protein [Bizionia paragorgiae]|jgi:cell division protein DivIC|uniref:Cell division protein FtsB n=1 Tax=Bizionia paragorgiae TaxID=283786 RepID=A0A1H4CYR5_BIZPA|nr:septum formation initiator family protein [Bizionia paragorgiae]MDX1270593.1 septum formation initiator family protein [Bizionia paragorgiae]SEA65470.1 Cell division protein FtsB [Bizionia paragorgiae]